MGRRNAVIVPRVHVRTPGQQQFSDIWMLMTAARRSGVLPSSFLAFTSAPCRNSKSDDLGLALSSVVRHGRLQRPRFIGSP